MSKTVNDSDESYEPGSDDDFMMTPLEEGEMPEGYYNTPEVDMKSLQALEEEFHTGRFGDKPFHAGEYSGHQKPKHLKKSHRTLV